MKQDERDNGALDTPPVSHGARNWSWKRFKTKEEAVEALKLHEQLENWLEESHSRETDHIKTTSRFEGHRSLRGTLVFCRDAKDSSKIELFHYYLHDEGLITFGTPDKPSGFRDLDQIHRLVEDGDSPVEGFIRLVNAVTEPFFEGMDRFEVKLRKMEEGMRRQNGGHLFHEVLELRYDLLHWKGLTLPVREIGYALEEVYDRETKDSEAFRTFRLRLGRLTMLQEEYEREVDSLLLLDDNISNYRGNEIMKTLTVFTVVCTPIMVLGSVWGMNFKNMPELDLKWGYALGLGTILLSTVGVYIWMRSKGWMGDLLRDDNKREEI